MSSSSCVVLIVGLGWAGDHIRRLCLESGIAVSATTTTGRDGTIPFRFSWEDADVSSFALLPLASHIVITYPMRGSSEAAKFIDLYSQAHHLDGNSLPHVILLGTTSLWGHSSPSPSNPLTVFDRHSPPDNPSDPRLLAETEVLSRGGCVLSLAGLWDDVRHPRNWINRLASSKEVLGSKKSLHLIHGRDIARAILIMVTGGFRGGRWIVTDGMVYDVWEVVQKFDQTDGRMPSQWVMELLAERGIESLPRRREDLGRALDSDEFWKTIGLTPSTVLFG
jgi:nucleoside-diphosphate-sugar epimerase